MIKLSDKIYLFRNDQVEGPFTVPQLQVMYKSGAVTLQTKFAQESDSVWRNLDEIKKALGPTKTSRNILLYIAVFCTVMFFLSFVILSAGLLRFQSGPAAAVDTHASSIRRVMAQHASARSSNGGGKIESTEQMKEALRRLYETECKIDLQGCPGDFAETFVRYRNALMVLHDDLPESTAQAFFDGMMRGLNGETDGGYSRLTERYEEEFNNIKALEAECV